jgi:hypothetical protein
MADGHTFSATGTVSVLYRFMEEKSPIFSILTKIFAFQFLAYFLDVFWNMAEPS